MGARGILGAVQAADREVAAFDAVLRAWDRDDAAMDGDVVAEPSGPVAEASALRDACQPTTGLVIRLGHGRAPGEDADEDASWAASVALARRDLLVRRKAGAHTALTTVGLQLLDRIDALLGERPDERWADAVHDYVAALVEARQHGWDRGRSLRSEHPIPAPSCDAMLGWELRHPLDHWLRSTRAEIADDRCCELIDEHVARLSPVYEALRCCEPREPWPAADIVADVRVDRDVPRRPGQTIRTHTTGQTPGAIRPGKPVELRQAEFVDGAFNGKTLSVLEGETWRVRARRLGDGSLRALDGSFRLAASR